MQYVSAEWVTNDDGTRVIRAIGDDGSVWWVPSVDSDVPPWPEYRDNGGEIAGDPPPAVRE